MRLALKKTIKIQRDIDKNKIKASLFIISTASSEYLEVFYINPDRFLLSFFFLTVEKVR